eukprot:6200016-Pleurochrysis_carterae.AAC.4
MHATEWRTPGEGAVRPPPELHDITAHACAATNRDVRHCSAHTFTSNSSKSLELAGEIDGGGRDAWHRAWRGNVALGWLRSQSDACADYVMGVPFATALLYGRRFVNCGYLSRAKQISGASATIEWVLKFVMDRSEAAACGSNTHTLMHRSTLWIRTKSQP